MNDLLIKRGSAYYPRKLKKAFTISLFALSFFVVFPFETFAEVTVGHTATKQDATNSTSMSWTHDTTGDADLLVCVGFANGDVSSLSGTFNGQSLTQVARTDSSIGINTYLFKLHNPPQGSHSLSFSWTTARNAQGGSISFAGSNDIGTAATNTTSWTTNPTTVTRTGSVSTGQMLFGCFQDDKAQSANTNVTAGTSHWKFSDSAGYSTSVGLTATGTGNVDLGIQEAVSGNPNTVTSILVPIRAD